MAERKIVSTEYEAIVKSMVEIRNQNGLSQKQLATQCGVVQSNIGRIENYTSVPSVETLLNILNTMGYTLSVVPLDEKTAT